MLSEIPYGVPKGKLIEQVAQAIADRKLPILEDVRDESDEQVRIVIVPKSRNVDPDVLMESLFKSTDLEVRFGLNMNVLDKDNIKDEHQNTSGLPQQPQPPVPLRPRGGLRARQEDGDPRRVARRDFEQAATIVGPTRSRS